VSPVRAPTLLIGVHEFGAAALARLEGEIRALGEAPVRTLAVGESQDLTAVTEELARVIDGLLRTRLVRVGVGRLDVVVIGDLAAPDAHRIGEILDCVSEVLVGFREALPMPSAPEQRTVTMVAVLGAPALLTLEDVRPLRALEEWHEERATTKALSRLCVLSRQHAGGTLSDDDVLRGVALFAASCFLAGLRDHDEVGARLQHRPDGELVLLFNAAAADVPVDSVVRYCAWRTALAGAETLHARCATTSSAGARDLARAALEYEGWVPGLDSAEAARKARTFDSDGLRPVAPTVPRSFGWRSPAATIRAAVGPLLDHGRRSAPHPPTRTIDEGLLWELDRAELDQLDLASARIDRFLRDELAPEAGARGLPRVAAALDLAEEALAEAASRPLPGAPPPALAVVGDGALGDPAEPLDAVLDRRVSPGAAVATASALGALAALVAAAAVIATKAAPGAASAVGPAAGVTITRAAGAGTATSLGSLLAASLGVGLLVGGGWLILRLKEQRDALRDVLRELRESATAERRAPPTTGSARALALMQKRLARALLQRTAAARQRVAGLRGAIANLVDRARRELRALGYVAADGQRPDNAEAVLGAPSPLHRHLLGADGLDRLWRSTRLTAEEDHWASQLLTAGWPSAGLAHDLPFAPGGAWETEGLVDQHRRLLETSAFGWAEVRDEVGAKLREFVAGAVDPTVVGLAVAPADADHVPLPSNQRAAVVVVAPADAQGLLETLGDARYPFKKALAATPLSRVVVLRAHPGCSARQLAWGVQARDRR
jgi:hypothetical protein